MRKQSGFIIFELLVVLLIVLGTGGWIANIVKLASSELLPLAMMTVLRIIGIFVPPLGAILGFM